MQFNMEKARKTYDFYLYLGIEIEKGAHLTRLK